MMSREELNEANIQIPQAIQYLVKTSTNLLAHIAELEEERDIYKAKYRNEVDLRQRISNDKALPTSDR